MWPLYLLLYVQYTWGILRNATIDDQFGDLRTGLPAIVYQPIQRWHFGPTCTVCTIKLDSQQTSNGSWHDSTSISPTDVQNITLSFNGSAIYIYCIVPDTLIGSDTHMNLDFSIDGEQVGIYRHDPAAGNTIHYNVPVYSNASLSHTQHQIVIRSIAPLINNEHSLLMFDYAVYSYDDGDPAQSVFSTDSSSATPSVTKIDSPTSAPASRLHSDLSRSIIIGLAILGLGLVMIILITVIFFRRRRRRGRSRSGRAWDLGGHVTLNSSASLDAIPYSIPPLTETRTPLATRPIISEEIPPAYEMVEVSTAPADRKGGSCHSVPRS